jgi:hypothetical protein
MRVVDETSYEASENAGKVNGHKILLIVCKGAASGVIGKVVPPAKMDTERPLGGNGA